MSGRMINQAAEEFFINQLSDILDSFTFSNEESHFNMKARIIGTSYFYEWSVAMNLLKVMNFDKGESVIYDIRNDIRIMQDIIGSV